MYDEMQATNTGAVVANKSFLPPIANDMDEMEASMANEDITEHTG